MTGRLLLDTCAIIWIALNQPIKAEARAAMKAVTAADEKVRVSPISAWELGLLCAGGRLAYVKVSDGHLWRSDCDGRGQGRGPFLRKF